MLFTQITVALLAVGVHAIPVPDGATSGCVSTMSGTFTFSAAGGTSQSSDGQVQQIHDGQVQACNANEAGDGQPQQQCGSNASEGSDGQPTQSGSASEGSDGQPSVSQISDGQIQASNQIGDGQVQQGGSGSTGSGGACSGPGALVLTLNNGVLMDNHGRTGYIASNWQFQFDNPPQSGATGTSGYSICNGNQLALNGNTQWWKCLSGTFYNLYSKNWAAQCQPTMFTVSKC